MLKILRFLLLAPFKNRIIGIITLFVVLTLFFRYFELQPSAEKKELNIGPMTFHVNPVSIQRRVVAKPIVESGSGSEDVQPSLPTLDEPSSAFVNQSEAPAIDDDFALPGMPDDSSLAIAPLDDQPYSAAPSAPASAMAQTPASVPAPAKTAPVRQSVSYGTKTPPVSQSGSNTVSFTPPTPVNRQVIRMGTVCLNRMNLMKFSEPVVQETLVRTAQSFDLLAVQGFYDSDLQVLEQWVNALNADGGTYSYLTAYPPAYKQDKNYQAPYVAFIFNRRAVDADRSTLLILECGTRMTCAPIAALFTARSTDKYPAFTFIAMNVWIDPARAASEISVLTQTFSMLQEYIRGEDDIVILGDFGININFVPEIARNPKLSWTINKPVVNYFNKEVNSNIIFYDNSCTEFQNQSGSFSVEKLTGLTGAQLRSFMPNPPVWSAFSVREAKHK